MTSTLSISASGLRAASTTFAVSARNVAGAGVRAPAKGGGAPAGPLRTQQTSLRGGGVRSVVTPDGSTTRKTRKGAAPGRIQTDTRLAQEMATQRIAEANFRANAAALRSRLLADSIRIVDSVRFDTTA